MKFPKDFPESPPQINFLSKVFHPLINYENGDFDISVQNSIKLEHSWRMEIRKANNVFNIKRDEEYIYWSFLFGNE